MKKAQLTVNQLTIEGFIYLKKFNFLLDFSTVM